MENQRVKNIRYIIADNLKLYRKKQKLTQMKLAELADLSLDSIKRIEAGQRSMSLENFLRLSEALQVPLSFLLYEQTEMPELEQFNNILKGRSDKQKKYLLHMLQEMAEGMDKLI